MLPHLAIKHWVQKIPHRAVFTIIQKASVRRASATHKQIIRPLTIQLWINSFSVVAVWFQIKGSKITFFFFCIYTYRVKVIFFVKFNLKCSERKLDEDNYKKLHLMLELTEFWSSTHQQVQLAQWQESQLWWQRHFLESNQEEI